VSDDQAFVDVLSDLGVLVMPGRLFETPGYFRICLTATLASVEDSLPRFGAALDRVKEASATP
jgi:aspartate aminotransferase